MARCATMEPPISPMESAMAWAPSTSWSRLSMPAVKAARTSSMERLPCPEPALSRWLASTPWAKASATVSGKLMACATAPSSSRSASVP